MPPKYPNHQTWLNRRNRITDQWRDAIERRNKAQDDYLEWKDKAAELQLTLKALDTEEPPRVP